jgi:uncharacterized membrane protein
MESTKTLSHQVAGAMNRETGTRSQQPQGLYPEKNGRPRNGLSRKQAQRLARGLGWFSIGLGLAEVTMPRRMAQTIGAPRWTGTLQIFGAREIATGIGILAGRRQSEWLWSRVGGDVMDLAMLASALFAYRSRPPRIATAMAAVAGVTALDVLAARELGDGAETQSTKSGIHVQKSITINRSPEELYSFWRDFENLPKFMRHLKSVQVTGDKRSHWKARAPLGGTVEWDAEVVEDRPNELISWRSLPNADVDNAGEIRFEKAAGNRGTVVKVNMWYRPPGDIAGAALARIFGEEPEQQIIDDLFRFKQLMETGDIISNAGPSGPRSKGISRLLVGTAERYANSNK